MESSVVADEEENVIKNVLIDDGSFESNADTGEAGGRNPSHRKRTRKSK